MIIYRIKQATLNLCLIVFAMLLTIAVYVQKNTESISTEGYKTLAREYGSLAPMPKAPYYCYIMNGLEMMSYDYSFVSTGSATLEQEERYAKEVELLKDWHNIKFASVDKNAKKLQKIVESYNFLPSKSITEINRVLNSVSYKSTKAIRWILYLMLEGGKTDGLLFFYIIIPIGCVLVVTLKVQVWHSFKYPDEEYDDDYDYDYEFYGDDCTLNREEEIHTTALVINAKKDEKGNGTLL